MSACPTPTKKAYASKAEARTHAVELWKHRKASPDLLPYLCRCGAWHVGHSKEHLTKRINRALKSSDDWSRKRRGVKRRG